MRRLRRGEVCLKVCSDDSRDEAAWIAEHRRRVAAFPRDVRVAHDHCSRHRAEVLASTACGCFYCEQAFPPGEIEDWVDDGETALCPRCGIDSVIGDASGFAITAEMLKEMRGYWF